MESNNNDNKKYITQMIIAFLLMLIGFVLMMMYIASLLGIEGSFGKNISEMWVIISAIPMILGAMILSFIPIMKQRKEAESYNNSDNSSDITTEQSTGSPRLDFQQMRIVSIVISASSFIVGIFILYLILGKSGLGVLFEGLFGNIEN